MRATLVLAMAAVSCGPTGPAVLRVRVLVDPDVAATCIVLRVNDGAGGEQRQVRGAGAVERDFTIERGTLLETVTVTAGAGVGTACADPLAYSGRTQNQQGTFSTSGEALVLHLTPPTPAADRDGDGFASIANGGSDCDDGDPAVHPGAPEVCLAGVDTDCDGLAGCADPDCAGAPCASAAAALQFASEPQSLAAGECSAPVLLRAVDGSGALAGVPAELAVTLQASPPDSLRFFVDGACSVPLAEAHLGPAALPAQLHVLAVTGGTDGLQATAPGLTPASQSFTVRPMVMTGACVLRNFTSQVSCPTPDAFDPAHAMLVFQAATNDANPSDTDVICSIASGRSVDCVRDQYSGDAAISWQILQRPELTVHHLLPAISGSPATVTIPQVARAASTFLLTSFFTSGSNQGSNDFRYSQLTSPTSVVVTSSGGGSGTMSLQVVEWPGSVVTRGVTPPMDGFTLDVTGLAPVDLSRTFLTYSLRTRSGNSPICDRTVRGELTSPTTLRFHRGDGNPNCLDVMVDAIGWERVQLPSGLRVQAVDAALAANALTGTASLSAAVDRTRTFLLAGSQYTDGQAGGEGSFDQDDVLGEMDAALTFAGPSQLQVTRATARGSARWNVFAVEVPP